MTNSWQADVVIVGAGLVGSSTAMHLAGMSKTSNASANQAGSVLVVDIDLQGVFSSSELNAGGVRATWNNPVNAAISKLSIDYYETVRDEVGFLQRGYFWMYNTQEWPQARNRLENNVHLKHLGIEYLSPAEITKRFPFIDKTTDLGGATFSPKDGLLNPNLLKLHFRKVARDNGAEFKDRVWITEVKILSSSAVELKGWQWPQDLSEDELKAILTGLRDNPNTAPDHAKPIQIRARALVNCSGAWSRRFAGLLNIECQCFPLRRQVSLFHCRDVSLREYGMFVDASGVYFHPEGNDILSGYATPGEQPGYNLEYEGENFFNEYIWPALYERSTKFENLRHVTGWAGLYEVSPDKSAVVGKVEPFANVYEAHSFSGRGAMQSYGAGLALAELIVKGRYETLDLSALHGGRFAKGQLVTEGLLI